MRWALALLGKELAALAPYAVGFAIIEIVSLLEVGWESRFLVQGFGERLSDGVGEAGICGVFGFLVGHGAVAHEWRDGHVEFLDGLPTRRTWVYVAKVVAASLLLTAVVAGSLGMDLVHAWVAPPPAALSPLPALLEVHGLMWVSAGSGLGLGLLMSWLGPLAWGVLLSALVAGGCAGLLIPPVRPWLPIVGSFGELVWEGAQTSHPLGPVALAAVVGAGATVLSGGLFEGPGQVFTRASSWAVGLVRVGLVGCGSLAATALGALILLAFLVGDAPELVAGIRVAESPGGLRVLYFPPDREHAEALAAELDDVSREVGGLLGDPSPIPLDVELLGAAANHLGVYTGGKIRLATTAHRGILAHELTHAHAFRLAGPAAWDFRDHLHFFEEGLADWVRARIEGRRTDLRHAAAIAATGQARFDEIVESDVHAARHDLVQSYVLGEAFVNAMVEVEGEEAPVCLLASLRDVDARAASGLALWYGLAAACELDLDAVQDRWLADLAAVPLPPLPALEARIADDGVWVEDARALGWPIRCGFRDDAGDPAQQWVYGAADDLGHCAIPSTRLGARAYQYQVGFVLPGRGARSEEEVVYLPWTDALLP